MAVARASYVAGAASTSNVLAGRKYGIPVFGTHAHSWVMSFDTELEAFRAFAKSMPNNCTLLIDTYDVREGIENAITVAKEMERAANAFLPSVSTRAIWQSSLPTCAIAWTPRGWDM